MEKPPSIWDAALQVVKPVLKLALLAGAVYLGMSMLVPAIGGASSVTGLFNGQGVFASGAINTMFTSIASGLGSATTFINGLLGTTLPVTFTAPQALGVVGAAAATGLGVKLTSNLRNVIVDNVTYAVSSDGPVMGTAASMGKEVTQTIQPDLAAARPSYQFDNPYAKSGHADRVIAERAASPKTDLGVA